MNNKTNEIYELEVGEENNKTRLDKFVALKLPGLSRSRLQHLIKGGNASIDGRLETDISSKVKEGQLITISVPPAEETNMKPANIPLNIVFEDDDMLVIDKPAGLTVHPGAGNHDDTMANALLAHCGDSLSGIGGVMRPGIVHRIDKDTSGLLVVAKNDDAHNNLADQIKERSLKRIYNAVIWGNITPPAGKIDINIARNTKDRKKMTVSKGSGKPAVTHYRTLEIFGKNAASLVECRLETGRTHQIRVHMQYKGHPLLGEQAYGKTINKKILEELDDTEKNYINQFNRQALHSSYIGFSHPSTGEFMEFESKIAKKGTAADINKLLECLKYLKS